MKKSIKKKKIKKGDVGARNRDVIALTKPEKKKDKKIIFKRPIYHNGRQYIVKIPREIAMDIGYKDGDMLKYTLKMPKDEYKKPTLLIEYVRKR